MRECHTDCHGPHILCNTSCHHVNSRHLSQNSEIEDLLLLPLIEIQVKDHKITQISLSTITKCSMSCCDSHLNCCHDTATGAWSLCYSWVCVTPTVMLSSGISALKMLLWPHPAPELAHTHTPRTGPHLLGHWSHPPHVADIMTPFLIITVSFAHYKHHQVLITSCQPAL